MMLKLGALELEITGTKEAIYVKAGSLDMVIERTGKQPRKAKWLEVWKEPRGHRGGYYNSAHYFAFGRRLFWSRAPS